jgi:hypothetical protein
MTSGGQANLSASSVDMWLAPVACPDADLQAKADQYSVLWTAMNKKMQISDRLEWEYVSSAVLLTEGFAGSNGDPVY